MVTHHIPTEEAKKQGLPGSDVFCFSHLLYHDQLHRDAGVAHLNIEAYKAFSDTIILSQRKTLAAEEKAVEEWVKAGGIEAGMPYPWGAMTFAYIDYVNYENFKIACGFELHLKARLLARDFIVHEVDGRQPDYKSLAKEQETRPISKGELFAVRSYCFNGQQNYLPGLKDASLQYSKLTDKPEYRKVLNLPDNHLDIIKDYRNLRNQIHFPGDVIETPNLKRYPGSIVEFINSFINVEIVAYTNELIGKYKLNNSLLQEFL